jgi:thioredoxin-like negative regulator of GroEL
VLITQGSELLSQGRIGEVKSSFSEAIGISSTEDDAYRGLAKAFIKEGDLMKALHAVEKLILLTRSWIYSLKDLESCLGFWQNVARC